MPKKLTTYVLLCFSMSAMLLAACSPLENVEQAEITRYSILDNNNSMGQTFVARYDGLQAVELWLEPGEAATGMLSLHLRTDPAESSDLRTATLLIDDVTVPGYYCFEFPPLGGSTDQYYFLLVKMRGTGSLRVGAGPGDAYFNGALYQNKIPQDAQLAFRLVYHTDQAARGLLREFAIWLLWILVALFLFVLPGWSLLDWLWRGWGYIHWIEKVALASGVSLAIYPLLILWTDVIGLHLGALYAWLPPLGGIILLVWRKRASLFRPQNLGNLLKCIPEGLQYTNLPINLSILIVLILVIASRLWPIRDLFGPLGSDSLHHTMIVQLILDNKGLIHSWYPYADMSTFTYHFGFHSAAAAFAWMTHGNTIQTTLLVGQLLNVLAIIALCPLAMRIYRHPWVIVGTMFLAGLFFPMPMYYITWGRYTQLAGQIILPAAVLLMWDFFEEQRFEWRAGVLVWLTMAGLALTHYRVLMFSLFFIPAYLIMIRKNIHLKTAFLRIFWTSLGSILLIVPWLVVTITEKISIVITGALRTPFDEIAPKVQALGNIEITNFLPAWIWLAFGLAIGWWCWRRNRAASSIVIWWYLVLIAANPRWLLLPGDGIVTHRAVITGSYFPAGIIIGTAIGLFIKYLQTLLKRSWLLLWTIPVVIFAMSIWGARLRLYDVRPDLSVQITRPDLLASDWIKDNTPPNAKFLVNSFLAFSDDWSIGGDAGWWLPILSNRTVSTPPMIYTVEESLTQDFSIIPSTIVHLIGEKGLTNPETMLFLQNHGITHIFIGQREGKIFEMPGEVLASDSHFKPLYHQDRTWIFEIIY